METEEASAHKSDYSVLENMSARIIGKERDMFRQGLRKKRLRKLDARIVFDAGRGWPHELITEAARKVFNLARKKVSRSSPQIRFSPF